MSVVVEPQKSQAPPRPDAGVIREARMRRARHRQRILAVLIVLAALGALIAGLVGGSGFKSTASGRARALAALQHAKQHRRARSWYISPNLTGGGYGWCVMEPSSASCPTIPTENIHAASGARAIGVAVGSVGSAHQERITLLLSTRVRGILADGRPRKLHIRAPLPYGLQIAQIEYPKKTWIEHVSTLLAIGADGRPLGEIGQQPLDAEANIRWWKEPARPASGPCQINAHGLPALESEWGHVAASIRPYPATIIGRAFFSCIDTEYYLHKWPLDTAILLDAQHPGQPPAPIPNMRAIPNTPGLYSAPGDWHEEMTATRKGNAWLVVAGGSGLHQREQVLAHLSVSVSL